MTTKAEPNITIKIIILGASKVGKTSLLLYYTDGEFSNIAISTVGIDHRTKYFQFDSKKVRVIFVDTAGQEKFRTISSSYLRSTDGMLLVYDITSKESFDMLEDWYEEARKFGEFPVVVLGNKTDLESKEVPKEAGEDFAKKINADFFEVSALTGSNVKEAFDKITYKTFLAKKDEKEEKKSFKLEKREEKKHRCCHSNKK